MCRLKEVLSDECQRHASNANVSMFLFCRCVQVEAGSGSDVLFSDLDLDKVSEFRTNVPTAKQKRYDVCRVAAWHAC